MCHSATAWVHCWWPGQLGQTIEIGQSQRTENHWKSVLLSLTWFTCVCPFQTMVSGSSLFTKDHQRLCERGERGQLIWLLCGANQDPEQPQLGRTAAPALPPHLVLSSLDHTVTMKKTHRYAANPLLYSKALFPVYTTPPVQAPKVPFLASRGLFPASKDLCQVSKDLCPAFRALYPA